MKINEVDVNGHLMYVVLDSNGYRIAGPCSFDDAERAIEKERNDEIERDYEKNKDDYEF